MITGKELIALGCKSGKWFPEAIAHINANNLSNDEILEYVKKFERLQRLSHMLRLCHSIEILEQSLKMRMPMLIAYSLQWMFL